MEALPFSTSIPKELAHFENFAHSGLAYRQKKLAGFDLLEDQQAIFQRLVKVAQDEKVDAIIIAGDLYDRALPNEAAVSAVNDMLFELNRKLNYPLLVVSGNHDSAVRLNTGRDWYASTGFI